MNENWLEKVGPPWRNGRVDARPNPERQENSRLSCQVEVSEELDGLR